MAGCTAGASSDFASAYDGAEVEPQVAVNPLNPDEIIGAAQQDRWPDGGARGLTSWISEDGAASWAQLPDVPWSACQGGPERFGRVTDPWVSYDGGGNAYFIGQPIDSAALGLSAVSITSFDREAGAWRPPQILIEDVGDRGAFNDKISVTGDPTRPGYAYATWLRGDYPNGGAQSENADLHSFAYRGLPMFSRTTDGGLTWSTPVAMRKSNAYFQGNQIAVLPDGTLLNVAAVLFRGSGIQPNTNGVFMTVLRSNDAGRTWSGPTRVAPLGTIGTYNPDDGSPLRVGDYLPDIAVDMDSGAAYIAWSDAQGGTVNHVVLSRSTDGGRHWSTPVPVSDPAIESFNHAVEVTQIRQRCGAVLRHPQQHAGARAPDRRMVDPLRRWRPHVRGRRSPLWTVRFHARARVGRTRTVRGRLHGSREHDGRRPRGLLRGLARGERLRRYLAAGDEVVRPARAAAFRPARAADAV